MVWPGTSAGIRTDSETARKVEIKKTARRMRIFADGSRTEREKTTRAREHGGMCRGGGGDAQGKASARAVTPTTSAA